MSEDSEVGKREIEAMVLDQVLDVLPLITGRTLSEDWDDPTASKIEGSPDHIIDLDGSAFGIELTEIRRVDNAWDYAAEAYRLASKKSESYQRRGVFRFPIALVMYSSTPALHDTQEDLSQAFEQSDFEVLGFSEIWAVDFSDAYYSPRDPRRLADTFCFKPKEWFGFHRAGLADRKPFG